jgi:hypothetical protein
MLPLSEMRTQPVCTFERERIVTNGIDADRHDAKRSASNGPLKAGDWLLRGLIAMNVGVLFLTAAGEADALWGRYRYGGWRGDVVWIFVSSIVIFVGALEPSVEPQRAQTAKLCRIWLLCFFFYVCYVVTHWFG